MINQSITQILKDLINNILKNTLTLTHSQIIPLSILITGLILIIIFLKIKLEKTSQMTDLIDPQTVSDKYKSLDNNVDYQNAFKIKKPQIKKVKLEIKNTNRSIYKEIEGSVRINEKILQLSKTINELNKVVKELYKKLKKFS